MVLTDLELLDSLTPAGMWDRFEQMCRASADVRILRHILGTREKMLEWIHSVGVSSDAGLASWVPPLPPESLRQIVAAAGSEEFLWTGLVDLRNVLALLARHGRSSPVGGPAVLDFGCGCGRLLRFLAQAPGAWRAVGTDVNRSHVAWCREELTRVEARQNDVLPPLDLPERSFDCIYSVSIFTHLREGVALAWLSELARLLRPGGVLVATTHGLPAVRIIRDSAVHQGMFGMTPEAADALLAALETEGFVFRPYARATLEDAQAGDDYGNAFVHARRLRDAWCPAPLELCDHLSGGLRGWQDVVVWRRSDG